MTSRALQYQQELKEHFFQKIFDEWDTKWEKFPPISKDDFEKLPSLNAFVEDLFDDIDAALKNQFPLVSDRKKVIISKENLRRILVNGNDIRLQSRTLNCLAYYLGFEDYEDFKEKISPRLKQEPIVINYVQVYQSLLPKRQISYPIPSEINYIIEEKPLFWKTKFFKRLTLTALMLLPISVGIKIYYSWYKNRPFTAEQLANVKFQIVEQYDKPNTSSLKIYYNVSSLNSDSIAIDYGYDEYYLSGSQQIIKNLNYIEYLKKPIDTVPHTYFKPNVWEIKLLVNGKTIRTLKKIVYSGNEWTSWSKGKENGTIWTGRNVSTKTTINNSILHYNKADMEKGGGLDFFYTQHQLTKDFSIYGDSLMFEVKVKNNESDGGFINYDTNISAIDINKKTISLNLVQDCIEFGRLTIADTAFSGKDRNFPFFDVNLQDWRIIGIKLKNNIVHIFVDGKMVFNEKYKGKIDKIKGVRISFKGSGSVDWVKLSNSYTGKIAFFDDFNRSK